MNQSLLRFKNLRKQTAIAGIVAIGLGVLLLAIGLGSSTSSSTWSDPSDTTGTSYRTYDECYIDFDNCIEVPSIPSSENSGTAGFGSSLAALGGALLTLALVSHYLILTSESIVEGMGGNITTEDPNASRKSKDDEPKA
jgi:hypothetical protein